MDKCPPVETVEYRGVKFRRYPESAHDSCRNYFTPGQADKERGIKRLHQEVYKDNFGPVPEGAEVHHRDGDPLNNSPENLVALTPKQHRAEHWSPEGAQRQRERMATVVRPRADEWHGSPEGRAWHAEQAKATWGKKKPRKVECEECGEDFETTGTRSRFCSPSCASRNRRKSGVDDEVRQCEVCPESFLVNKHKKTRTCSPACTAELIARVKQDRIAAG